MSRTLSSPLHSALHAFVAGKRKAAGLTQTVVAKRLGRHQSYVANVENGLRRIDVVELIELATAIGFDPVDAIVRLKEISYADKQAH